MRILIQFVSQSVGVILLRRKKVEMPYKMWLFPLPALIGILVWLFIFFSSEWVYIAGAFGVILSGVILFLVFALNKQKWPFDGR